MYMRFVPMGLVQNTVLMGLGIFMVRPAAVGEIHQRPSVGRDAVVAGTARCGHGAARRRRGRRSAPAARRYQDHQDEHGHKHRRPSI